MVDDILKAMLWRSRLSVRAGGRRAFAGDGYVDPSYRPPETPFVSVVGPLSLAVEPERENGQPGHGLIAIPGHIIGAARPDALVLPPAGALRLRFDRRARLVLALAGLPVTPFGNDATGPAVAAAIGAAIAAAVAANQVLDDLDQPIDDPAIDAALAQVVVAWSPATRQLAISSAPGIAAPGAVISSVEVLAVANDLAPSLGWTTPAVRNDGRLKLHKLPAPRPVTVEIRVDLWTSTQSELAHMFDALAASAPTRGGVALRPALLAADPAMGASTVRLLTRGEPTTTESLVHLEGGDGVTDRVSGTAFALTAPAAVVGDEFSISAAGRLAATIYRPPLVPDPLIATNPAPLGFSVAVGLALGPPAAVNGDVFRVVTIQRGTGPVIEVFAIEITIESVNVPGDGPTLFGSIVARATLTGAGGVDAVAQTRMRVRLVQTPAAPVNNLTTGGTLHARVDGPSGLISLWFAGEAQNLADPLQTPVAPTAAPGQPRTGFNMVMTLGNLAGALPRPLRISHAHVEREPIGPLDPRLRGSVTAASQLRPGDQLTFALSSDGWRTSDARAQALVVNTSGDLVTLSRPLPVKFSRGGTLVFQEQCFYFQTGVKRRDDLLNHLYHTSIDYKVSALLEDPTARTSAHLVLFTREEVTASHLVAPPPKPGPTQIVPPTGTSATDPSPEVH
jgi:hypothetical protein